MNNRSYSIGQAARKECINPEEEFRTLPGGGGLDQPSASSALCFNYMDQGIEYGTPRRAQGPGERPRGRERKT